MPADSTVEAGALREFVQRLFVAAGLAGDDASTMADSVLSAELRGTRSHGLIRLPFLVNRLLDAGANSHPAIRVVREAPATALLDGDGALGPVTATRAMALAIEKARSHGVGCVAVRNSDFIGTCAHYAMMALPHDMLGVAWTNGFPGMAPWGGRRNTIGNNPIAFAAPSATPCSIVLDMALSVAAGGKVRLAAKSGARIPKDWLVDRDGEATDDPGALSAGGALLPLGYKGFGLAVFGEILCGALSGARMLGEIPAWFTDTARTVGNGHLHIAIDIARFVEPQSFKQRVAAMVAVLKATPRMPGVQEVLMPGERAWRTHQQQLLDGIAVPQPVAADLVALARRLKTEAPPRILQAADTTTEA